MRIVGIPAGWQIVRIGELQAGEWYIDGRGVPYRACYAGTEKGCAVIKRIEPPQPKYIPWTRETCPVGAVVVGPIDKVQITRCNKESCYLVSTGYVLFSDILQSAYRYNGKPCGSEVKCNEQ